MREIVRGGCTNTARKSTPTLNSGRQVLTASGSRTLTLSVLRPGFRFDALPTKPHPTRQAATAGLPSFCHCHSCLHHCQALLSFRSVLFCRVHPRFAVTFSSSAGTLTLSAPIKAQLQDSLSLSLTARISCRIDSLQKLVTLEKIPLDKNEGASKIERSSPYSLWQHKAD